MVLRVRVVIKRESGDKTREEGAKMMLRVDDTDELSRS